VPEVRRLLLALIEPSEPLSFHLGWSHVRRRHQAIARRCRAARRAIAHPEPDPSSSTPLAGSANRSLTEEDWDRVAALLPPPYAGLGRPPLDHRVLLEGMLWVMERGGSWRELPQHFGKWNTVYCRYRKWRREGLWHRC
jgi:hypothetical protein